ncbi:hypothetical protein M406DRAFT_349652 [Cryphonectria parasitica EP155]|uniref:Uncharacterized protein n=1 Tax=Cryphonectria parasitica (strain ATCC 38755 / EP155) TaxID=660469 RepID=A0A9P4YD43_CRYP1|nr:uncharacterized protein M406DRAFT_349652 [Cryphonectria parasitica EP155]KAF3771324.1 hypothetical protein M406DRAFT_349652 [Cryphonectria parasitica EP155]
MADKLPPQISNPFLSSSFPSASSSPENDNTPSARSDPPPPLPADLDNPTPQEDAAVDDWLRRNTSYITTIPWFRYPALPALSLLWGYSDADFRDECLESLLFYTRAAGRRLSLRERDAVLEPITRTAVAASYDRPVALGLAAWLMARSWAKSGHRAAAAAAAAAAAHAQQYQQYAAAAAAAQSATMGTVGADGHITHFSGGQTHHQPQTHSQIHYGAGGASRSQVLGTLARRVVRTGSVGLFCAAGYYVLWTPWRFMLGNQEVDSIREDLRLEKMCQDMDRNMNSKVAEMLRRHGGS